MDVSEETKVGAEVSDGTPMVGPEETSTEEMPLAPVLVKLGSTVPELALEAPTIRSNSLT